MSRTADKGEIKPVLDNKDTNTHTMSELNKRASIVASLRRIATKVLAEDYATDIFEMQQHMNVLQMHFERFLPIHDELTSNSKDDAEVQLHTELYDQTEELYNKAIAGLQRLIAEVERQKVDRDEDNASALSMQPAAMELKLDPLSVPKFDGTLKNWLAFKDAFETLVHNRELPEAYKLGKLREAVKGDAVQLVGGMYSGGYAEVWRALTDRYDNPKQLADIHVARFIGLKQPANENTSALLSTVDTVREALRALRVMKLPVDQWDALAVPIVTSKLPLLTQQAWGMSRITNDIPTLEELLTFIERRAHSLASDVLHWPSLSTSATSGPRRSGNTSSQARRLVKTNLVTATPDECHLCPGTIHVITRCPKFLQMTPLDRYRDLKKSNYCFNCLLREHSSRDCTATRCRKCDLKHHTLLHRDSPQGSTSTQGSGPTPQNSSNLASTSTPVATTSQQPPRNHTA